MTSEVDFSRKFFTEKARLQSLKRCLPTKDEAPLADRRTHEHRIKNNDKSSLVIPAPSFSKDFFPENNIEIERYLHFTNDTHKGSRRGSRNSSSASATSIRSNRSLQHHKIPEHHPKGNHTVVTDPQQLFSVNQQQHIQHQLMIHQQQRRRSSIHQSVVQHAPAHHRASMSEHPSQPHANSEPPDVKVEITEVKP